MSRGKRPKSVVLLIETSNRYERELLYGIRSYVRQRGTRVSPRLPIAMRFSFHRRVLRRQFAGQKLSG